MQPPKSNLLPLIILGVFFFIFGFVTWLNSTLILYLKIACELTTKQALLVATAFYISYFIMAIPMSWILKKTGYKNGMMLGLIIMALGCLLFVPAAQTRMYPLFLSGLFIIGTGLTILQTASNPYITILGPINSAARRISIMGIANKVAGAVAPLILGAIILNDADTLSRKLELMDFDAKNLQLNELASRVILPYSIMAGVLGLLAIFVRFSPLPEIEQEESKEDASEKAGGRRSIFAYPHLLLGAFALFLYVGVEVITGDTIGTYATSLGIKLSVAKTFPSYTLSAMVLGYILGIFLIPRYLSQTAALTISAVTGILFSGVVLISHGYVSILFVALLGLANALVWPAIWPLALEGLGRFTKTGSAILIMAILGGALLPQVYSMLADGKFFNLEMMRGIGYHYAYWILLPCYCFILFYSMRGYAAGRGSKAANRQQA